MAIGLRLPSQIASLWERERGQWILFLPLPVGLGAALYFSLRHEPTWQVGACALIGAVVLAVVAPSRVMRWIAVLFLLAATGYLTAKWETARVAAPVLERSLSIRWMEGRVEQAQRLAEGTKLILADPAIERLPTQQTPRRISVTFRKDQGVFEPGERVRLRAGLYPPPPAAMPGAFDFARHFYFRGIGAVGFGVAPITRLGGYEAQGIDGRMAKLRATLSERLNAKMNPPYGALAAGFLTGETSGVPESVYEIMRVAGLTHLLAVSGFNLVIVTGILFFMARLLLSAPYLALRFPTKRWAAFIALVGAYFYLRLTGAPVSAERAFIMTALVLVAVMIDRVPTPLRSIALAAMLLLLLEPHSVLTASFQLSFAATLALIAFYDRYRLQLQTALGPRRVLYYFSGAFFSALVAGLATAPYILYHFNQIATYTLLANMLAAPLVTFWIMPGLLIALALMPLGWDGPVLKFTEWGLSGLNFLADRITQLPAASFHVPAPTDVGIILVTLGGLWLCLLSTRVRLCGVPLIVAGLMTSLSVTPPNLLVSADGKQVALREPDGKLILMRGKRESFQNRQWLEALGQEQFTYRRTLSEDDSVRCDAQGCEAEVSGLRISVIEDRNALLDTCGETDILIAPFRLQKDVCSPGMVIDENALQREGAHAVYITQRKVTVETARQATGDRPWSGFAAQ